MSDSKKNRTHFLDESANNKFIDPREKSRKRRFNWQEEVDAIEEETTNPNEEDNIE